MYAAALPRTLDGTVYNLAAVTGRTEWFVLLLYKLLERAVISGPEFNDLSFYHKMILQHI